jgi:hypothetical protein
MSDLCLICIPIQNLWLGKLLFTGAAAAAAPVVQTVARAVVLSDLQADWFCCITVLHLFSSNLRWQARCDFDVSPINETKLKPLLVCD